MSTAPENDILVKAITRNAASLVATAYDNFYIHGPNGSHICLVLPVLGPSFWQLSNELKFHLHPSQARRAACLATEALASLQAAGICHGDVTMGNFVFAAAGMSGFTENDIYAIFGRPVTGSVSTVSGISLGPETPHYQIEALDFLSTASNMINMDTVYLIDFDQSFSAASPPATMLGTPAEYLTHEVTVGERPSIASDFWSLACTLFRLRSGHTSFHEYEVSSPVELLRFMIERLGQDLPPTWQQSCQYKDYATEILSNLESAYA